ncbi:MAG TPA: DUF6157 family protein [Membranihabitans sp.]|nr:DUF6157 family protein [Membranihabitans sp.]
MKQHTTNYYNTLIEPAEDCPVSTSQIPAQRGDKKSIALYQLEMMQAHPYQFTSDDLIFEIYAIRKMIPKDQWEVERKKFFSKGQPCLRTSPLAKRYGWGIHSDNQGKLAVYPMESQEYEVLAKDPDVFKKKAMKSSR